MIIHLQIPQFLPHPSPQSHSPKSQLNPNPNSTNPNPRRHSELKSFLPLKTLNPPPYSHITNPGSDSGLLFRQKVLYLDNLNVNSSKALTLNPNIRCTPLESIKSVPKCLYSMGIQYSDMGRILDMYPQLLTCNIYTDLYPIFEFLLNDVKIPFGDIRKCVTRCPRLLICCARDQLKPTLGFLRGLGFVGAHAVNSHTTVLLVSSVEGTLVPKIDFLCSLGISYKEVVNMVLRSPGLLTFSIANNFEPKVEYFLNEMKGDVEELKKFPQYFSFNLEGRIKPRHRQLVQHGLSLSLADMLKLSDGRFELWLAEMRLQSFDRKLFLLNLNGDSGTTLRAYMAYNYSRLVPYL